MSSSDEEEEPPLSDLLWSSSDEEEEPPLIELLREKEENVTIEDVEALVDKYPDSAKEKNGNGHLPLQYAVNFGASVEVIQLLIKEYPDAVKEEDGDGWLPLHLAVNYGASDEVVQLLIKEYPDAVKEKDENGSLPLHIAVGNGASVEVVQLLIKEYPDALKEKDGNGWLPLHYAVKYGASVEVMQLLITGYPDAAKEKTNYGHLPLHHAVERSAWEEVVQLLIKEYPDAVKEKDGNGFLPLHFAVGNGASTEVVQLLIKEYPDALKEKNGDGSLPLHFAVGNGASAEVVQLLIKEYPDALKEKNEYGDLPLHLAINNGASDEVIQLLIKEYPDAAKEKNDIGFLPLQVAVWNSASVEVIQLLIQEYPDSLREKDEFGALPLHFAIQRGASTEVVKLLIKEHPDALMEKNWDGDLLLHTAIKEGVSVEVIQLLIQEYPDAVKEKNEYADLPLHWAVRYGASVEVMQVLIKEYPDAAREKNKYKRLPLHYACEKVASVEVIQLLIKEYPDAVMEKDRDGELPLHRTLENAASIESIQFILNAYPLAAKEMMRDGRLPIEVYLEIKDAEDLVVLALLMDDMPVAIEDGMPVEHSGSWFTCVSSNTKIATAAVRQVLSNDEGGTGYGRYIHALAGVRDAEGRTALETASSGARTEIYEYLLFCGRYKLQIGPPEHRTSSSTLFRAQDLDEKANYGVIFDKADKNEDGNLDKKELSAIEIAKSIGLDPDLFLKGSDKNTISKAEFIATCKRQLGDGPREVVIKFMHNKDHWERETKARVDYQLSSKYVVSALTSVPSQTEIAQAVERGDGGLGTIETNFLDGVKPGKYAIIMNAAERNLHQILYQEQPKIEAVRDMLRQVFEAVQHLHDQDLMHGDLKMVNIVRFRIDNKLRLIDLDASARIAQIGEEEESFAGAKSSSAILPPEMIERIETDKLDAFTQYWKAENDNDLYEKVKPKPYRERGVLKAHYVVKSFRTKDGQPVHNGLPYELVNASSSIDAWSLGVLAFTLLTGETLIPSTFVDDCASGAAMHVLYSWGTQPEVLTEVFKKIHDGAARDLVSKLLQYEPGKRPTIASLLKDHPFFNAQSGVVWEKLEDMDVKLDLAAKNRQDDRALLEKMNTNIVSLKQVIKKLGDESKAEFFFTRSVFVKAIFGATAVDTPTTFIILKKELPPAVDASDAKVGKILDIIAKEDASGVSMETKYESVTISANGQDIVLVDELREYHDQVKIGMKWAKHIKDISLKVAAGDVNKAFKAIKKAIEDLIVGEEMYLYLVDELTGEPVRAEGWPLTITKPSDLVPKLLPLMLVGMRGLSLCSGVAGLARMCGYPVPKLPETLLKGARESVKLLKQESSVEEFVVVHEEVNGGTGEKKSVRGASLREFVDFMKENDPGLKEGKSGDFAGLQRIGDPEDGTALWTALTEQKDIENALKKRAEQRKEEQMEDVEQLKQNMHTNDTAEKEVDSARGEGNEVEVEISDSKVTTDEKNRSRMPVEYSEETTKEAAEAVSVAVSVDKACCAIM